MNNEIERYIETFEPCGAARVFLRGCETLQEAWETCTDAEQLVWHLRKTSYFRRMTTREGVGLTLAIMDAGVEPLVCENAQGAFELIRRWYAGETMGIADAADAATYAATAAADFNMLACDAIRAYVGDEWKVGLTL